MCWREKGRMIVGNVVALFENLDVTVQSFRVCHILNRIRSEIFNLLFTRCKLKKNLPFDA